MTTIAVTRRYEIKHAAHDRVEFAVLEQTVSRGGLAVFLRPQLFRLALCMTVAGANNRNLSVYDLVDVLFVEDPDGGPEFADRAIFVAHTHLRKALAPLGLTITRERTSLYRIDVEPALEVKAA